MCQKDGSTCANVNCSHDCLLVEVTAITPYYAGEVVSFFPGKSLSYDPTIYQMVVLNSAVRSEIMTHKNYRRIRQKGISNWMSLCPQRSYAELHGVVKHVRVTL